MPFVDVNGLEIYYERHGQGPPLLNIGGSGGDLRISKPDRSPLNKHFDVIHYDQRGLGQTTKPQGPYSVEEYADDAAALMDVLGVASAHVLGTSFGGMVALQFALRHHDRVNRMVVNCTSPGGLLPSFPIEILETMDVEAAIEMKLGILDNRWDPGRDEPIPGFGDFYDVLIERSRTRKTGEDQRAYLDQLGARSRHDVSGQLGKIQVPLLVCAGEYDDQAPLQNSVAIVEGVPDAELRVFQGGHLFMIQDRSAFGEMIAFLQND